MTMTEEPPGGITRAANSGVLDDAVGATLPVGFRATSDDEGFLLVVKPRPKWAWILAMFALAWNGFLACWFTIAIVTGQWSMAAFGTIHAVVGVGVGYAALRGILNRVEVSVSRGVLSVRHRPLPWVAPRPLARDDIDQLFVREDKSLKVNGRPVTRFALMLRDRQKREHQLCIVEDPDQAGYLEREIEAAFRIEDRAITRELPKA